MAHSERCCKVFDNFDKDLKLPSLFSTVNPPEKTCVSDEKHYRVLVVMHFDLLTNPCFLCRRIIRHGIACLRLRKMLLLLMIARRERQLLELYCKEKYPVLTVASKNPIFFN
jgi:hypothetical protein